MTSVRGAKEIRLVGMLGLVIFYAWFRLVLSGQFGGVDDEGLEGGGGGF
jgi:hypothetical protein